MGEKLSPTENITVIQPPRGWLNIDFKELWQYRELFVSLVWRDIQVKYKQSLLGILWAVLVPLLQMIIFTIIFGRLAKLPTDGIPPQVYYYSGLIIWTFFATSVNQSSMSLVSGSRFITKIYFPRVLIPSSHCFSSLVDFAIAFLILIGIMIYFGISINLAVIFAPIMIIMALGTALGTGFFFSAINVKYRDIRYALPFLVQIWQYGSVIIPFNSIPESWGIWRYAYGLNPVGAAIEGFRWCLLNTAMFTKEKIDGIWVKLPLEPPIILLVIGFISMIVFLVLGIMYFKRMEYKFADIV